MRNESPLPVHRGFYRKCDSGTTRNEAGAFLSASSARLLHAFSLLEGGGRAGVRHVSVLNGLEVFRENCCDPILHRCTAISPILGENTRVCHAETNPPPPPHKTLMIHKRVCTDSTKISRDRFFTFASSKARIRYSAPALWPVFVR